MFFLSGVKGTFRLSVPKDGPAYKAGVPDGSWLLAFNGASVERWTSAQLNKKVLRLSVELGGATFLDQMRTNASPAS